ncbi:uncharacterized protein LOC119400644 [Rhipicephalus sanguineus]|uniref:uncharacterized protein LOC119400644 n=1 Tax=Rhipicephalus sanguineus TaxID=34632 RepID=UPI0020C3A59D|nr:uncharacterized protein LOC119400644 [Rhipicephalus sanguineus]
MGDHVLVKWASEDKWDVYPVRNIKSQTVVCQLVDDPKYVTTLTNQTVQVLWQDDEYAPAYILGIGSQVAMERKRTRLVLGQASRSSSARPKVRLVLYCIRSLVTATTTRGHSIFHTHANNALRPTLSSFFFSDVAREYSRATLNGIFASLAEVVSLLLRWV